MTFAPGSRSWLVGMLGALVAPGALAQWSTDAMTNSLVGGGSGEQVLPKIASSCDGGTYVGWFDNASGNYDVRLQRFDAAGVAQWASGGIVVSAHPQSSSLVDWDLIADSSGHCVLVFTDVRDGGDLDVFAYRVSDAGTMLWGVDGVQLSANSDFEPSPRVCETSSGEFAFVWARLPNAGDGRLSFQRLSAAGSTQLAPGGVSIVVSAGESPAFCDIVAADGGSVIVSWLRNTKTFASPRHVRARKFAADGSSPWASHVNVFDAISVPIGYYPKLDADGAGGAVVCWHRSDVSGVFNAFVQRITSAGAEVFAHNGVAVATTTTNHIDPSFTFDATSGATTVVWNERNAAQSQWGIYGQRIDAGGARLWGAGGKAFVPLDGLYEYLPQIVGHGSDAVVVYGDEPTSQFGKNRALAFRVDVAGNLVWSGSPLVIASTPSTKSRLPTTIDCTGNVRVAWEDDRNGTPDVYAQAIHLDGALGGAPSPFALVGSGSSGTFGIPNLNGTGTLCAGTTVTLEINNALPNAMFALVVGASAIHAPFFAATLVPSPDVILTGLQLGPSSFLPLAGTWPIGVPPGSTFYFQVLISDPGAQFGVAVTNGVAATTP